MIPTVLFIVGVLGLLATGYMLYAAAVLGFSIGGLADGAAWLLPGLAAGFIGSTVFISAAIILEAIDRHTDVSKSILAKLSEPSAASE